MSNATIGSIVIVIFLSITIFVGLNSVADNITGNSNLDLRSQEVITELNGQVSTNYQLSNLQSTDGNLSEGSTFEGTDAFVRQYLEDKNSISEKKSTMDKIIGFPDFLMKISGFDSIPLFIYIIGLIGILLGLWIFFASYKAVRTGEVD